MKSKCVGEAKCKSEDAMFEDISIDVESVMPIVISDEGMDEGILVY